ncbi:hypothetical protein PSEUDO9AG_41000 [Pseudomonas sp. 9Ag]|nr:hypothetical protein PSEUDO9AG_41000 [Pseudomonas sp. 9Ag]
MQLSRECKLQLMLDLWLIAKKTVKHETAL